MIKYTVYKYDIVSTKKYLTFMNDKKGKSRNFVITKSQMLRLVYIGSWLL